MSDTNTRNSSSLPPTAPASAMDARTLVQPPQRFLNTADAAAPSLAISELQLTSAPK